MEKNIQEVISLEITQIQKLLPHKYPFLFLDRVEQVIPGQSAVGIKNISINEPFFCGHFEENPIMPGALIIEAMAQLTAIVNGVQYCLASTNGKSPINEQAANHVGYLAQVKQMKFYQLVIPGDQLVMKASKKESLMNVSEFTVSSYVRDKLIAKGVLVVTDKE
ncbi:3-hydroxyacyl-ACP dehydratase FabZ [Cellulosilyticum ruminicola]|uniref:3-hydroxyacyl-ACP dehydratase FabZ n=1 Tax=Cellulosilyticum ruminicola TaxID=425254 RepID=UPI0006CF63C5|nr:3-hydroxyacyl-ACP dehydratase FabZ [Cellulosilyticum ruminicola]